MSDPTKHENGEAAAALASALAERLIRRGTEPLGVIDVRYAEEKYSRIVRWLGRHSALLDHLRSRYGVEEAPASAEHLFAIQQPLGQQVNVYSTTIQSPLLAGEPRAVAEPRAATYDASQHLPWGDARPSSLAQVIAERSVNRTSEQAASPEPEFRISRRPPPMLRKSDAPPQDSPRAGSVAAPKRPAGDATVDAAPIAPQTPPASAFRDIGTVEKADVPTVTSTQEHARVWDEHTGTASSIVQREVLGSSSARERFASMPVRNERGDTASSVEQREPAKNANTQEPPARAAERISNVQREAAGNTGPQESPASETEQVNKISSLILQREAVRDRSAQEPPANAAGRVSDASSIVQQEVAGNTASQEPAARDAVGNLQTGAASSIVQRVDSGIATPAVSSLPLIRPLAEPSDGGPLSPAQSAAAAAPPPEYPDVQVPQDVRRSRFVPGAIAAPEIRGDSFNQGRPRIVWREPQAGPRAADLTAPEFPSASPLAPGVQSGTADFFPAAQRNGQAGSPARAHNQTQEIQLEQISPRVIRSISERVIRAITLDLKLERERRGVTKWR